MNTSLEVTHQLKNLHDQAIKSADSAIGRLKYYGLDSPTKVEWIKRNKPGTERPFGEPEAYQEKLKNLAKSANNEQSVVG